MCFLEQKPAPVAAPAAKAKNIKEESSSSDSSDSELDTKAMKAAVDKVVAKKQAAKPAADSSSSDDDEMPQVRIHTIHTYIQDNRANATHEQNETPYSLS